jgi:uncharacterized protein (TIGR00369 family)
MTDSPSSKASTETLLESPFVDRLGAQLVSAADGASEVALPLQPDHMNTWDVAHGGVTMTLADIALAMAARSLAGDGVGVVTVEMKVNFMQPGRGELRATARVLHRSTTMARFATAKATSSPRRSARSNTCGVSPSAAK